MMYHALLREGMIRLPQRKAEAIRQMDAIGGELHCLLGRQPTATEMAWEMGVSERDLYALMVLQARQVVSLDVPVDEDGEVTLAETVEDSIGAGIDEGVASPEDLLRHVTEQQRVVLLVRYGFGDGQPCTQAETARLLGMKLNKVQELDRRARIRLRRVLVSCSA
jgi:RNA polymerase nonessential primary-like sigma factor